MNLFHRQTLVSTWLCVLAGLGITSHAPVLASGKSTVSYVPGVSLVPEVLTPNGTPRIYTTTANGVPTEWTKSLPVYLGDKVKLNVFAATGGAELKQIIVRLDNTKIADLSKAPWNTTLDTKILGTGPHMVEVWALSTGDHPQSTTETLAFSVASQLATQYVPQPASTKVGGFQQVLINGKYYLLPLPGDASPPDANTSPTLDFLKEKPLDTNAQVAIYALPEAQSPKTGALIGTGTQVTGATLQVSEPYLLSAKPVAGSSATKFAYALVRDGQVEYVSSSAFDLARYQVRIGKLSNGTGLGSGEVALWVWGINKAGQPAEPVKTMLAIP